MKREADVKELLISNAIHLVAEGGFEKATTKELAYSGGSLPDFKMNEVYIYRLFGSKEGLYEAAFLKLDDELFCAFQRGVAAVGGFEPDTRERLQLFFLKAWDFILDNEEKCRCYVRYYYSVYFKGASLDKHKLFISEIAAYMRSIFNPETHVEAILHSVFVVLLDFAIRVHNKEMENTEESKFHIFCVLYYMMAPYFKKCDAVS